jgi:hypothetical protein
MQPVAKRVGFVLCISLGAFCAILHAATFIATLSLYWILPLVLCLFGIICCANMIPKASFSDTNDWTHGFNALTTKQPRPLAIAAGLLFLYFILTFVYFYRTTGGASSVAIVDGRYVSMYKSQVIRTITEAEYRIFPSLWTRVISVFVAMMSVLFLNSFVGDRSH